MNILKNASLTVFLTCIRLVFFVYRLTVVTRYSWFPISKVVSELMVTKNLKLLRYVIAVIAVLFS